MERKAQEPEIAREVRVKLSDEDLIARAQTMAAKVEHIQHLRRKKRDDSRSLQALIESELDEVERLARVINAQEELRRQGDLFVADEIVDQETATRALAEAARAACTCPGESAPPLVDCPVHGDDAPATVSVAEAVEAALEAEAEVEEDEPDDDDEDDDEEDEDDDEAATPIPPAPEREVRAAAPRGPLRRASKRSSTPASKGRRRR